jgi:hypothetical protein
MKHVQPTEYCILAQGKSLPALAAFNTPKATLEAGLKLPQPIASFGLVKIPMLVVLIFSILLVLDTAKAHHGGDTWTGTVIGIVCESMRHSRTL